jgi:hypothetical protein
MSMFQSLNIADGYTEVHSPAAVEHMKVATKKVRKTGNIAAMDPTLALFSPGRHSGATSERFYAAKKEVLYHANVTGPC